MKKLKLVERAEIISMLMRDVRMAGFKYYAGTHEIARFATKSNDEMGCTMKLPN